VRQREGKAPKDWFIAFMEAMLIFAESNIRREAGMPPLLDSLKALQYSVYLNLVICGSENPRFDWEQQVADVSLGITYLPGQT
jgi:hypothetical protein